MICQPSSSKPMNENRPVLVVSPPRSGSSLTASILQSSGLFGGETKEGDRWNARGYFENLEITELVVEYLKSNDTSSLGKRYHPENLSATCPGFGPNVVGIMKAQGLNTGQRWFYKNTKIPLCWQVWNRAFPEAQWVIVQREREQIIRSLLRAPFMNAYDSRDDWNRFLDTYDRLLSQIRLSCSTHTINIDDIFENREGPIERMLEYVSRGYLKEAKMQVDRRLWHAQA